MGMNNVIVALEAATDNPLLFVLYTAMLFALMSLVIAVAAYFVMCRLNRQTELTGVMRVGVVLNQAGIDKDSGKADEKLTSAYAKLDYGEYLVGMEDSEEKYVMNPKRSWLKQADVRRYPVEAFLGRFYLAFSGAGFGDDEPAALLLKTLLRDDIFCAELGKVYRRSGKKGLKGYGLSIRSKDGKNPDKLSVYAAVPNGIAELFKEETACTVETICVVMEYTDSLKIR